MSNAKTEQCTAITKSGSRCKLTAQPGTAYCHLHQSQAATAAPQNAPTSQQDAHREALLAELDALVEELKASVPDDGSSPYNPLTLLTAVRSNLNRLAPEAQLGILESFRDMTREDLMDIETWKGMAYMMSYSARFQAEKMRDRMNEQMPGPLKPDTVSNFMKQNFDRYAPELIKGLVENLQESEPEDWLDPDTWKGMFYMINYSLQFQAEQLKQRLGGQSTAGDEA